MPRQTSLTGKQSPGELQLQQSPRELQQRAVAHGPLRQYPPPDVHVLRREDAVPVAVVPAAAHQGLARLPRPAAAPLHGAHLQVRRRRVRRPRPLRRRPTAAARWWWSRRASRVPGTCPGGSRRGTTSASGTSSPGPSTSRSSPTRPSGTTTRRRRRGTSSCGAATPKRASTMMTFQVGKPRRATIPSPKPEEYAGILDGRGEANGAVERPESGICQAFAD